MPLASMTGFGRDDGQHSEWTWAWELRSVNSRGLDVRLRLPPGMDRLEQPVRGRVSKALARGSVSAGLQLRRAAPAARLSVNRDALDQVLELQAELAGKVDSAPPRLEALLAIRGVAETMEDQPDADAQAALDDALIASFGRALDRLVANRGEEGARLHTVLSSQLTAIGELADEAVETAAAQPEALKARLAEQVTALLDASPPLPEERLAQEAALLASRADVREETDRLAAHVAAAEALVAADGPVGRKMDFLCQELNREANTLCSKAADLTLTNVGLALKAAVEQFREQVQNVE